MNAHSLHVERCPSLLISALPPCCNPFLIVTKPGAFAGDTRMYLLALSGRKRHGVERRRCRNMLKAAVVEHACSLCVHAALTPVLCARVDPNSRKGEGLGILVTVSSKPIAGIASIVR